MITQQRLVTGPKIRDLAKARLKGSTTTPTRKSAKSSSTVVAEGTRTGKALFVDVYTRQPNEAKIMVFRFPTMDECLHRCFPRRNHAQPLEKAAKEGSKSGLSQAAEVGLGVCLSLLLIVALGLGLWYYKMYRDKENYRIFQVINGPSTKSDLRYE